MGRNSDGDDHPNLGNTTWFFYNYGLRSSSYDKQRYIDKCLKCCPAIIVGIAECQEETAEMLESPAVDVRGQPPRRTAVAGLNDRAS